MLNDIYYMKEEQGEESESVNERMKVKSSVPILENLDLIRNRSCGLAKTPSLTKL